MAGFSKSELTGYQWVGGVVLVGSVVTAVVAHILHRSGAGVPEFMLCLRGSAWTAALLSAFWLALSTVRRMSLR